MKPVVGLFLLILAMDCALAQQRSKNSLEGAPISERVYIGGGGSFGAGTDNGYRYTYVSASPIVGYRVTRPFSMGAACNYIYYSYPDVNVTLHQYGISPYAQYMFGKLFAYAEYSIISVPSFDNSFRTVYTRFPIGLGFSQPIGPKASINAMALYDIKWKREAFIFPSPWVIRIFVTAGGISM